MDFGKFFTDKFTKLNFYVIPQFLWLTILYYIMINVFYKYYLIIVKELNIDIGYIPIEAINWNSKIMYQIDKWLPLMLFLGIALFLSGLIIVLIRYLPVIKNYNFSYHSDFGLFVGSWLILIWLTIKTYQWFDGYFLIIFIIITVFLIGIDNRNISKKSYTT